MCCSTFFPILRVVGNLRETIKHRKTNLTSCNGFYHLYSSMGMYSYDTCMILSCVSHDTVKKNLYGGNYSECAYLSTPARPH